MTYVENLDGDLGVSMHYISNIKGGLFHKKLVGTLVISLQRWQFSYNFGGFIFNYISLCKGG